MTDRWQEFLQDQGLQTGSDGYSHTDGEHVDAFQKLSGDTLCDLGHTALVRATGADAESFLQNQLTNDLDALSPERALAAGYCNAKGRLICLLQLQRDHHGILMQLPAATLEASVERLRKYVLRARVELATDHGLAAFGVNGKTAAKGLEKAVSSLPRRERAVTHAGAVAITRLPGNGRPRFQVTGPADDCIKLWEQLGRHAHIVGSWTWSRLDILAGLPNIHAPTSELFIPQMVNLDLVGGVNFQKGCYPGQEIVARMHHLGKLKQRMARFRVDAEQRPEPGHRVCTQGRTQPTGTVVDAQPGAGSGWELLAVVRIEDLDRGVLRLRDEQGPQLFQQDLPYRLDTT